MKIVLCDRVFWVLKKLDLHVQCKWSFCFTVAVLQLLALQGGRKVLHFFQGMMMYVMQVAWWIHSDCSHRQSMEWRVFFVSHTCRAKPMPMCLAQCLLQGMACPAILLWDLETLSFFMVTEAISCPGNFTFECFPCIALNACKKGYFAIPPATSTSCTGTLDLHDGYGTFSLPVPVKLLEFQPNFSKTLPFYLYGSVILVVCYNPYGVFGFDFTPGRFGSEPTSCLEAAMLLPCNFFPSWIRYLGSWFQFFISSFSYRLESTSFPCWEPGLAHARGKFPVVSPCVPHIYPGSAASVGPVWPWLCAQDCSARPPSWPRSSSW